MVQPAGDLESAVKGITSKKNLPGPTRRLWPPRATSPRRALARGASPVPDMTVNRIVVSVASGPGVGIRVTRSSFEEAGSRDHRRGHVSQHDALDFLNKE